MPDISDDETKLSAEILPTLRVAAAPGHWLGCGSFRCPHRLRRRAWPRPGGARNAPHGTLTTGCQGVNGTKALHFMQRNVSPSPILLV